MRRRFSPSLVGQFLLLSSAALWLTGCRDTSLPPVPAAGRVITFGSVTPNPSKPGDSLTITFSADKEITSCSAQIPPVTADCALSGLDCTCTIEVTAAMGEGAHAIEMGVTAADADGTATHEVDVDLTKPTLHPGQAQIVRRPVGTADAVSGSAGAVVDQQNAATYSGMGVASVRFYSDATSSQPLLTVTPGSDGSWAATNLTGTASASPPHLFAEAVDNAGNVSDRVEILQGGDQAGPVGSGNKLRFVRRDLSAPDGVLGDSGAFSGPCGLTTVHLFSAQTGGTPLASLTLQADGSFAEAPVGSATSAPARLWASGVDKCGVEGARAEILVNADLGGPLFDGTRLTIVRRGLGASDGVLGQAGAFTDASCALAGVEIADLPGVHVLTTGVLSQDGSFAELPVGTTTSSFPRLWATATTKCATRSGDAEALVGEDVDPPTVSGAQVAFIRHDRGTPDGVAASPGAATDAVSAVRSFAIYDSPSSGGILIATGTFAADGSFAEVATADPNLTPRRLYVSAEDKANNASARVEILGNEALDPVMVTAAALQIVRRDTTAADGVSGSAGAFVSSGGAAGTVDLYDVPSGGSPIGTGAFTTTGAMVESTIGTGSLSYSHVYAEPTDKAGNTSPRVQILAGDSVSGPVGTAASLHFVRRDLSAPDGVLGLTGAYQGTCFPASVVLEDYATSQPVASGPIASDGSIPEIAIGTNTSSYPRLFAVATNKCGQSESSNTDVAGNVDTTAPTVDGTQVQIVRRDFTAPDTVVAPAGTLADADAVRRVQLFRDSSCLLNLASGTPNADGSFDPIAVGTTDSSPKQVFVRATDKPGNVSLCVRAQLGEDLTAPSLDGTKLSLALGPPGIDEVLSAAAGAVDEPISRIQAMAVDGGLLGDAGVAGGDGSLAGTDLGDPGLEHVYAVAIDKAGNTSAPALAKHVAALLDLNQVAGSTTEQILYAAQLDGDPRGAWPGMVGVSGGRVLGAALAGALGVDGESVDTIAVTESIVLDGGWTPVSTSSIPNGGYDGVVAYDSDRQEVLFGGGTGFSGATSDLHAFSGNDWQQLSFFLPHPVAQTAVAFDAAHGLIWLFGGSFPFTSNDLWSGDGSSWTFHGAPVMPQPRSAAAGAYDLARGVFVMFGGANSGGFPNGETWEFDGTTWTQSFSTPAPQPRSLASMAYDPVRGKTVLFGGLSFGSDTGDGAWEWDGATWTPVSPSTQPSPRHGANMTWSPSLGQVLLFSGSNGASDTWTYDGTAWTQQSPDTSPGPRSSGALAWDSSRDEAVLWSGRPPFGPGAFNDTWVYQQKSPHVRWPAQAVQLQVDRGATPSSISVTYVGAGSGDSGGSATWGIELLVWNWTTPGWTSLGTHSAQAIDDAAARTISAALPGAAGDYLKNGRLWLLVVPLNPSSAPGGTLSSQLDTDYASVSLDYTLP